METKQQREVEALSNFANKFNMDVRVWFVTDKRKNNLYYLVLDGVLISPNLDYNSMNHFLLGWDRCVNLSK